MAYKIYIEKSVYCNGFTKTGRPYQTLQGVWFMVGDMAHYLSRETYDNTWNILLTHSSYLISFGDISDEHLIEYFSKIRETAAYEFYMQELENLDKLELWADEAPIPKGSDDCITSSDWVNQELELAA